MLHREDIVRRILSVEIKPLLFNRSWAAEVVQYNRSARSFQIETNTTPDIEIAVRIRLRMTSRSRDLGMTA